MTEQTNYPINSATSKESRLIVEKHHRLFGTIFDSKNLSMDNLKRKRKIDLKQILEDNWHKRAPVERRSDRDKRVTLNLKYFKRGGQERRRLEERRKPNERRDGWMRVGKWRSEAVFDNEEN